MPKPPPIDIDLLLRRRNVPAPKHLNVRITGDDATIWEAFAARTPGMTDSQRIRDAVRIAAYCLARRDAGNPVRVEKQADDLLLWLRVLDGN